MTTLFICVFPILIATCCLLLTHCGTSKSMLIGTCFGVLLYFLREGISAYTLANCGRVLLHTVTQNIPVLLSIFFLLILVNLIQNSKVIDLLNQATAAYMQTTVSVTMAILLFGVIFSLDDYLACMAMGAIVTRMAKRAGVSNEKTAFMINLTAVSCCCISPFSSWMPVIKSALTSSGLDEVALLPIITSNFIPFLGLAIVSMTGILKPYAFHSSTMVSKNHTALISPSGYLMTAELKAFYIVLLLLISGIAAMTFVYPCNNPVLKSALVSIVAAAFLFSKTNAITVHEIRDSFCSACISTWDLSKLLIAIWCVTNVCSSLLNMNEAIRQWVLQTQIPREFLPFLVYVLAAVFAFFTGSAYGSFGLFIPIAVRLNSPGAAPDLLYLTVAAAISGSLFAASSFASETVQMTAKSTKSDINVLQYGQLPYWALLFTAGAISFQLSAYMVFLPLPVNVLISITTAVAFTAFSLMVVPKIATLCRNAWLQYILLPQVATGLMTFQALFPAKRKRYLYQQYIEAEKALHMLAHRILRKYSTSRGFHHHFLKLPAHG